VDAGIVGHAERELAEADAQIEAVSFGEERPKATGADESSYAENRRADILYDGEDKPPVGK
jgi:peptidoglycan-associated lipoprotein